MNAEQRCVVGEVEMVTIRIFQRAAHLELFSGAVSSDGLGGAWEPPSHHEASPLFAG